MADFRKFYLLLIDVFIFSAAGISAWFLRAGFEAGLANFEAFLPYFLISASVAIVVFQIFRLHLHFFRFFSIYELVQMAAATFLAVLLTVLISFLLFRLDAVHRSVPFLHFSFALGGFMLTRAIGSVIGARRDTMIDDLDNEDRIAALVVGYTSIADLFLRSVPVIGDRAYFIAGILDENSRHLGHRMRQSTVIGHPVQLEHALSQMLIHGVAVRKVFLCIDRDRLEPKTITEIERLETEGRIELHDFAQHARAFFDMPAERPIAVPHVTNRLSVPAEVRARAELAVVRFGPIKRVFDIVMALVLGAALLPLMLLILPAIRFSMGSPVIFWQERPGRHGKVFRLFKLRTLSHGVNQDGRLLEDAERQTFVGRFLRRTRLDEIPQLVNVLAGDMSFVGPRPLLPLDLPSDLPEWNDLRAMVRPGLTGWAQVNGGQEVSKEDKVVMDASYISNMSLTQDLRMIFLTLKTVIHGEKLDHDNIGKTYEELGLPYRQSVNLQTEPREAIHLHVEEQRGLG